MTWLSYKSESALGPGAGGRHSLVSVIPASFLFSYKFAKNKTELQTEHGAK